jgi:hypothetical protein
MADVTRLLLPFSISGKERTLPFTQMMEKAIIYYLVESDRKKGEGLILRKPVEKVIFVAPSCYPVWLIPWGGKTLLFDGLGVSTRTLLYEALPDVKAFVNDVEGSAEKREAYSAALSDHIHYFQTAKGIEEKTVLGLIPNLDFVQDLKIYLSDAEEVEESEIKDVCLSPIVDESTISSGLNELAELKAMLEKDVQNLREAMRLLGATTRKHTDSIRQETKKIQAELNEKISAAKALAMEEVRQIQEKYDSKISKNSQKFEKQLEELHLERTKQEKQEDRAFSQIERCDDEIRTAKTLKDSAGERRWKEEKEKWKREFSTLKKSMEVLNKEIENTESQKKIEITNIRAEFNAQSEDAMKDVRALEALKDSKTQRNEQEMKSLESLSTSIVAQLDKLAKQKRLAIEEFDRMGIREQRRKRALAYLPCYLACFKSGDQRKYTLYPPSIAGTMSTITKFKGMFGVSRAKSLFQQRSRAVTQILNQLSILIERDPVFKRDLHDAGVRFNLLETVESREEIVKGLEDLRNEEWISASEAQTLIASLRT